MVNLICPQFFTLGSGHLVDRDFLELTSAGPSRYVGDKDFLQLASAGLSRHVRENNLTMTCIRWDVGHAEKTNFLLVVSGHDFWLSGHSLRKLKFQEHLIL